MSHRAILKYFLREILELSTESVPEGKRLNDIISILALSDRILNGRTDEDRMASTL